MVTQQAAESVDAVLLHDAIRDLGITHVVTVPDTHQRTLIDRLLKDESINVVIVSTEDEAIGINAGLYMGGAVPMMLIQQLGIFAGVNALRGIALDMNVPTFILAGLFGRDVTKPTDAESQQRAVRLVEPLLDALGVPHYAIDGPDDVGLIRTAFDQSRETHGPAVVFVGAPTK
jgi:sulfopyruvate decarboxylase TPP-binding subunit